MPSWTEIASAFIKLLEGLGPWGLLVVALVVGLAIAIVLIAHFGGLYNDRRASNRATSQNLDFVDRLIGAVDKLSQRELDLRAALERQEREAQEHMIHAVKLEADVDLMREQLRRTIETLREVRDGRLPPSAIKDADLVMGVGAR